MRTLAILPIKCLDAAKNRLSGRLGGGARAALAQAMLGDVLAALGRVRAVDAVAVVTSDRQVEAMLRGERVSFVDDEQANGQSAAAKVGIRHAIAAGFDRVLLVPGDTPLVDPVAVDDLLAAAASDELEVTIVPDRHGTGSNALLIAPPDRFEPSFGPGSLERHAAAARASGLAFRVAPIESLGLDVDTPDDLNVLVALLAERRVVAPRTRGALSQIARLGSAAPRPGATVDVVPAGAPES